MRLNISEILQKSSKLVKISLLTLVSLGIASSLSAPLPIYALTEIFTFLSLAMLALAIAATVVELKNLIFIFLILATWIFIFFYEVKFLTSYIAAIIVDHHINFQLLFPHFGNVRFFNQFQIWLLPISLTPLLILKINNKTVLYLLYLMSGIWITIFITTQSRGAQLSFLFGLIITLIVYGKTSKQVLKITSIASGFGTSIYLVLFQLIPNTIPFFSKQAIGSSNLTRFTDSQDSFLVRMQLWKNAFGYIQEHPILGISPMHFAYYPGQHAHPHNSVLQIASEFGLPFAFISASLLVIFIFKWLQFSTLDKNSLTKPATIQNIQDLNIWNNQQVSIMLFFALISGLIYSTVSGIFVMPMAQTMMAIIIGLMIGVRNTQVAFAATIGTFRSVSIQIMAGMIAIGLLLSILPHLTTRVLNPFFATYLPQHTVGPRYWEIGGLLQEPAPYTPFYYKHPALIPKDINNRD